MLIQETLVHGMLIHKMPLFFKPPLWVITYLWNYLSFEFRSSFLYHDLSSLISITFPYLKILYSTSKELA